MSAAASNIGRSVPQRCAILGGSSFADVRRGLRDSRGAGNAFQHPVQVTSLFQSAAVSTPLSGVITALSSLGSVNWRTAIERTQTHIALAVRRFLQWGRTGSMNFCRPILAAGKPSFLPLVHDANQPTRGIFHRFSLSPVLSLPALHAQRKAWSRQHDAQKNSASGAESYE